MSHRLNDRDKDLGAEQACLNQKNFLFVSHATATKNKIWKCYLPVAIIV